MDPGANVSRFSLLHFGEATSPYAQALQCFCAVQEDFGVSSGRAKAGMSESSLLQDIRDGRQFGALVTTGAIAAIAPGFYIADLPYVFETPEHVRRFWHHSEAKELVSALERTGLVILAFYDAGTRHFFNRLRPVATPDEMSGLRIRTLPNRYHRLWVEALGAVAVAMPTASICSALEEGQIDGAERSYLNYRDLRCLDVAPFFTTTHHFHLSACLVVSKSIWDSQDRNFQERCLDAADKSATIERNTYKANDESARRSLERQGLTIVKPDISAWQKCAAPVLEMFRAEAHGERLLQAALGA
jgi:TRAP-type C4-dicarboxylate transport system substrate-binding protein